MKQIRERKAVIEAQLNAGHESTSGLRDAFDKHHNILTTSWLDTLLGPMLAISDEEKLYLLEFDDRKGLENEIKKLKIKEKAIIIPGRSAPIDFIENELKAYFEGKLKEFHTPLHLIGSNFQKQAWQALCKIPYGETRSYAEQAISINKASAHRAVANANGANQLAIIIPCHRIINSNGNLGGYGGGIPRKKWLIEHEKRNKL